MALSNGPNLGVLVDGGIAEVHYNALMQQWRAMDALVQPRVKSAVISTPPISPADGDCYIIPPGSSGAWSAHTNKIARYSSKQTAWEYYTPKNGWVVHNEATSSFIKYNGTVWVDPIINKADLVDGKVPADQLPSYVDDILEFPDLASFPVTGESGKIYVAIDTGNSYRWSGSVYTKISQPLDEMPQAVAEAGTSDTLYAATARRIRQAIAAWWLTASSAFGRTLANVVDAAAGRTALGLGTASTATVTTSATDTTVGRLLKVGDFGLGGAAQTVTDLNTYTFRSGFYAASNTTLNKPIGDSGYVIVVSSNDNVTTQIYNTYSGSNRTFIRTYYLGTWTSWVEIAGQGRDATFAALTATGLGIGTSSPTQQLDMTGNLLLRTNSSYIAMRNASGVDSAVIQLNASNVTNVGAVFSGAQLALRAGAGEQVRITSTGIVRPGADNTQSLGEASFRWSTVHTSGVSFPATQNASADANTLDDYREASYTATATGMTTAPTGSVSFVKTGNSVTMTIPAISGTSNATTFTLTGGPTRMRPSASRIVPARVQDNGGAVAWGMATIGTDGVITLNLDANGAAFTATGMKATAACTFSYTI